MVTPEEQTPKMLHDALYGVVARQCNCSGILALAQASHRLGNPEDIVGTVRGSIHGTLKYRHDLTLMDVTMLIEAWDLVKPEPGSKAFAFVA